MNKCYCVISHTHWDREWYMGHENMRIKLCNLINNLIDIIKKDNSFIFHLDAQTIVLEDYLEVFPKNKSILKKYIKSGNIIVGPWYVQNDFYLSAGESTIRNLLYGKELAKQFGACGTTGYCPDQFGIIGQLPQILKGFNITNFVFGRGLHPFKMKNGKIEYDHVSTEFKWVGTDKTAVTAIFMKFWYNNAQRFPANIDKAVNIIETNKSMFEGFNCTPYVLLMNGVDHLEAQEDLLPILEKANKLLPNGEKVKQYSLESYIDEIEGHIKKNDITLKEFSGELRQGTDSHILQGTLSSRVYLKQSNNEIEDNLINIIEPLYTLIQTYTKENVYPEEFIKYLWKQLIPNHAHDSICGCSNDCVHRHMEDRFERMGEISSDLITRAVNTVTSCVELKGVSEDYKLVVINTTQMDKNESVQATVYFKAQDEIKGFEIFTPSGQSVLFRVTDKYREFRDVYDPINLPFVLEVDVYKIVLEAVEIKAFSVGAFLVKPSKKVAIVEKIIQQDKRIIENDGYTLSIESDGKISLFNKVTNKKIDDFIDIQDEADIGSSYIFERMNNDTPILLHKYLNRVTAEENCLLLDYSAKLPSSMENSKKRSDELIENELRLILKLKDNQIEVAYTLNNCSEDHRLRLLINTGINSEYSYSNSAFEVVKRRVGEEVEGIRGADQPNSGMVSINDDRLGCSIYNKGLHEYQHIDTKIALTIVRATKYIVTDGENVFNNGSDWIVPDNQCKRQLSGAVGIEFFEGTHVTNKSLQKMVAFRVPLVIGYASFDVSKLKGNRAALQDTFIGEIFYREDEYKGCCIPVNKPLFSIDNNAIVVTAIKKGHSKNIIVLRVFNTTNQRQVVNITTPWSLCQVLSLEEKTKKRIEVKQGDVSLKLKPWEIVTIANE